MGKSWFSANQFYHRGNTTSSLNLVFIFSYKYDTEWSANTPSAMGIYHSGGQLPGDQHYYIGSQ